MLETLDVFIEEGGKEDSYVWEYGEWGPTYEELDSDKFELEESKVGDSELCDSERWDNETSVFGEVEHEIEDK